MSGKNVQLLIAFLIGVLCLAACNGDDGGGEDIELPTRINAESVETNDVVQEENSTGVTPTAPPDSPSGRPTLPPSWTPTVSPTSTIAPTVAATSTPISTPIGCGTFRINREGSTSEFRLGETPTIDWTNVDGASFYRIRLFDENQLEITLDPLSSTSTSLDLNPDFFTSSGRYGWVVEPIGADGIQMCTGMGETLIVNG